MPSDLSRPIPTSPTRAASTRDWILACAAAHALLCRGDGGWRVEPDEAWVEAIGRVAGQLLEQRGQGRDPRTYWTEAAAWEAAIIAIAKQPSTAPDGLVAGRCGRVSLASFSRGV